MGQSPNILFIMTDQHSPHISGFAGNDYVDTQALDNLADQSIVFESAYCQSPLCVPSRMSLWSGKYPHHIDAWANQSTLPTNSITIPAWLSQHGYTTASVGKIHFRGSEQMHGFQYRPFGDLVDTTVSRHQPDPPETVDGRSNNHAIGRFPFAGATSIPETLHSDTIVTIESLSWLLEFASANPDKPWFFCASYYRPHFPLTAPKRYIQKYLDKELPHPPLPEGYPDNLHPHDRYIVDDFNLTRFSDEEHRIALASYYAALDYVDDRIGELLTGLQKAGCLENTYIVYTSDHGDLAGEHGLWWKRSYYEASARVPLLISGSDIRFDHHIDTPVELVDLFPTICDFAGIDAPNNIDGESLKPLMEDKPNHRQKQIARSELLGGHPKTRFRMIRDQRWKYVDFPSAPPRLFDLENDPNETQDLIDSPPDATVVNELKKLLNRGGTWDDLEKQYEIFNENQPKYELIGNSSSQFRLKNGRIIEADDHLYDNSRLGGAN